MGHKRHVMYVGFAEGYKNLVDFWTTDVSVVIHRTGAGGLSDDLKSRLVGLEVFEGPSQLDLTGYDRSSDQILELAEKVAARIGPPTAVVALFENNMLAAARLRDHFGTPGPGLAVTTLFRNKVVMKQRVAAAGVQVPWFYEVSSTTPFAQAKEIACRAEGRIVLKPTTQASSIGIRIFDTPQEFLAHASEHGFEDGFEVEEFIDGTICHFDGVIRDGVVRFLSASRYLGTPFGFRHHNTAVGSVTIDDPGLVRRAEAFTDVVLTSLGLQDGTFHLEAFLTSADEFVFLEVACRFAGGGISEQIKEAYGVDLVEETILASLGQSTKVTEYGNNLTFEHVGASGSVCIPLAEKRRCKVTKVFGLDKVPESVIMSEIPNIAQVLNDGIVVMPVAGRFYLVGENSAAVTADMQQIIASYSVEAVAL
jgi:biotin carboxylase